MIITRLIGGLGNQLFQYAVARHLVEINRTVLKIDVSGFETYKLHKYSLWPFNIQENFASPEEVAMLTPKQGIVGPILRRSLRKPPKLVKTYIREKDSFYFDREILSLSDGVYLDGYWGSEKYFIGIEDVIRREFTVKTPQMDENKELAELITACEAVSIHIRRGDFVSVPYTNKMRGTCGLDYYLQCASLFSQCVKNPHFFIFSDDPDWVHGNFSLAYPNTIVDYNKADRSHEDLRLMSRCKHNIIANSTFSWWAAWLNPNPDKIVIASRIWFRNPVANAKVNFDDLYPKEWIMI